MPDLLKLDIEGLEPEALKGLSSPPAAVLFEFHHEALISTKRSVERLEELGSYEFNYTVGEWLNCQRSDWTSGLEVLRDLEELGATGWGNVGPPTFRRGRFTTGRQPTFKLPSRIVESAGATRPS